jgi:hypothetical protein
MTCTNLTPLTRSRSLRATSGTTRCKWRCAAAAIACAFSLISLDVAHAAVNAPLIWYAARSAKAETNWLYGDDSCDPSDRACNRCVPFVSTQLKPDPPATNVWLDDLEWDRDRFTFRWDRLYSPSGLDPSNMYPGDWEVHAQGFVHANPDSAHDFFAMSHSGPDDTKGSISLIDGTPGDWSLAYAYQTQAHHPSGMFAIGYYLGFVDGSNNLSFIDLSHPNWGIGIHYGMPTVDPDDRGLATGGGGVAMARLRGGGHLLTVAQNGDDAEVDFFFIDGNIEAPRRKEYLGRTNFFRSQNISLFTECGSGHIYAVFIDGSDSLSGGGYFVLGRLGWDEGPDLSLVGAHDINQEAGWCWPRGGASVSVMPSGIVELVSVERDVIEFWTDESDDFSFCQGSLPYAPVGQL